MLAATDLGRHALLKKYRAGCEKEEAAVQKDLTTLRERLTVKQNSDHARQAAELAVESRRTAQKGREVIDERWPQ